MAAEADRMQLLREGNLDLTRDNILGIFHQAKADGSVTTNWQNILNHVSGAFITIETGKNFMKHCDPDAPIYVTKIDRAIGYFLRLHGEGETKYDRAVQALIAGLVSCGKQPNSIITNMNNLMYVVDYFFPYIASSASLKNDQDSREADLREFKRVLQHYVSLLDLSQKEFTKSVLDNFMLPDFEDTIGMVRGRTKKVSSRVKAFAYLYSLAPARPGDMTTIVNGNSNITTPGKAKTWLYIPKNADGEVEGKGIFFHQHSKSTNNSQVRHILSEKTTKELAEQLNGWEDREYIFEAVDTRWAFDEMFAAAEVESWFKVYKTVASMSESTSSKEGFLRKCAETTFAHLNRDTREDKTHKRLRLGHSYGTGEFQYVAGDVAGNIWQHRCTWENLVPQFDPETGMLTKRIVEPEKRNPSAYEGWENYMLFVLEPIPWMLEKSRKEVVKQGHLNRMFSGKRKNIHPHNKKADKLQKTM